VAHIHAIGDVAGGPLLAHKAIREGHTAAEVIAGLPAAFDPRAIPSVAYTDPEVAWTGVTEIEAAQRGLALRKGVFPWTASGRALGTGRSEGLTKLLFCEQSGRLVGAGVVGRHAGELIAELTHAIEMGSDAEDLALTIHAHPTLSESVGIAAEAVLGMATDLPPTDPARRRRQ
jgi:dihydrolipoamide dehydrogenase